jgi:hypothetical protein
LRLDSSCAISAGYVTAPRYSPGAGGLTSQRGEGCGPLQDPDIDMFKRHNYNTGPREHGNAAVCRIA